MSNLNTMDDVMWEAVARPRFLTFLLTSFAAIALVLAAFGIYGVIAHTVVQRTHEIGIRVALGAQPAHVRSIILRGAGALVAVAITLGLAAAVAIQLMLADALDALLYGGTLLHPVTLGGVVGAVSMIALVATWIPVRRATRVDPIIALRSE